MERLKQLYLKWEKALQDGLERGNKRLEDLIYLTVGRPLGWVSDKIGSALNEGIDRLERLPKGKPLTPKVEKVAIGGLTVLCYGLVIMMASFYYMALAGLYQAGFFGWAGHAAFDWFIDPHCTSWSFWDIVLGLLRLSWHWLATLAALLFYAILVVSGIETKTEPA